MTDNKGYKHAGDVDIRSFKLVSAGGQIIDIENITVDFSVYQSIFDHYLQCDLVINDWSFRTTTWCPPRFRDSH